MNKMDTAKRIIIVYVGLGIMIPVILKYAVFENTAYSLLSNEGWAGFLGSYVGGVFGGLGTLIAMYMTIRQTIDIQEENKKDTDAKIQAQNLARVKEYNRDKADRDRERREDHENRERELRIQFSEDIAELVGRYITDISKYHYASLQAERLDDNVQKAYAKFSEKYNEYEQICREIEKSVSDEYSVIKHNRRCLCEKRDNLWVECNHLERDYERKQKQYDENSNDGNRLVANEAYFIMKTKLSEIPEANGLIMKLEEIHRRVGDRNEEESPANWINQKCKELMEIYDIFRKSYVK